MDFGITGVAAITVIAYLIGQGCKALSDTIVPNRFIPIICGAVGAVLGPVGMATMSGFPAQDILTAVAVGIVSGLAATGVDQIGKQLSK